ncbi:YciI family protein [Goodfellowiella coeruleoviolacea]|uniref:YCII-related domain-containing protein n=1 Tax=Goodfellowiella coeruleoviolacea TaxID=334858 RepID=A0AAE3GDA6_9PSEU|nr:YciI family protein [Goodfellowiella coeruleoviolacea]MCP2166196.1 hypothetical protein [Goodfellowiella coeruleoviolacea]
MARYAVLLEFGENTAERLAVRPAHREYLGGLVEQGKLLLSGPWADDTGALLVYETADEAELRALLAADPYTAANVVARTEIREWNLVLGSWLAAIG